MKATATANKPPKHSAIPGAEDARETAYLVVACGGTGRDGMPYFHACYQRDGAPFGKWLLHIDTEDATAPEVDDFLSIRLGVGDIKAVKSDPKAFGPVAEALVEDYPHLLREDSLQHGSRTIRPLTQLAVEVHLGNVVSRVARGIRRLIQRHGAKRIQPVFAGSSGGGMGSALIPLLGSCLAQDEFVRRVTKGLPAGILQRPLVVVADPIAYADKVSERQAHKILANSFAFRIEMDLLDREHGAFQQVYHQGLANAGGATFESREEICRQLGIASYQLCRYWQSYFKPMLVNTPEGQDPNDRYRGHNVPERDLPPHLHPPFAAQLPPRRARRRISLTNGYQPPRSNQDEKNQS